ncbi:MAG TPA: proline dehydrogenase family protein [Vicinamibacterales bacterium]|nr:proline dehydrogenase family protein [Vicinamibacterales bacterium]
MILEAIPKAAFSVLAGSNLLKRLASRYGMRRPGSFARRFIAGESVAEAIEAARQIEAQGLLVTLDLLGESVATSDDAAAATRAYLDAIAAIEQAGVGRNISLKLTQLGLDVDKATCIDNLRRILNAATTGGFFVRIDMENSPYTDLTIEILEVVWNIGHRNVGTVIQSYLKRSARDIDHLNSMGVRVRLVKGAYREPADVAYQQKADVDAAYIELMRVLLRAGTYPAIATHDPKMIEATTTFAAEHQISKDKFEFQMLYGIRRDLQTSLAREGHPFRVYVPFGKEWFPYFMRRLGERPANVGFIVRSLIREK